jgi:hypothetical protein
MSMTQTTDQVIAAIMAKRNYADCQRCGRPVGNSGTARHKLIDGRWCHDA